MKNSCLWAPVDVKASFSEWGLKELLSVLGLWSRSFQIPLKMVTKFTRISAVLLCRSACTFAKTFCPFLIISNRNTHKVCKGQKTLRRSIKMIKRMQAFPYEGRLTSYGAGLYVLFVQHSNITKMTIIMSYGKRDQFCSDWRGHILARLWVLQSPVQINCLLIARSRRMIKGKKTQNDTMQCIMN